jgi:hypothetical protein
MVEVVDRGGPYYLVAAAVRGLQDIVGAIDIYAILTGMVGVFEDIRFTVRDVLPERHVGVGCPKADGQCKAESDRHCENKEFTYHIAGNWFVRRSS